VNITLADVANVKAASTTDLNISGTTGEIEALGGKNVTVTDATAGNDISVGASGSLATGSITVTDTKLTNGSGSGDITILGGTSVTVTATDTNAGASGASGSIVIGSGGGTNAPTGAVNVTLNLNSDGTAAMSGGTIAVTGGTTVDVTVNATNAAKDKTASGSLTAGKITATSDGETTTVTIKQNATITPFAVAAVAEVKATNVVTFGAMDANDTITVEGLTFTASKALTAEQAAAAFADLVNGDKQDNGGPTSNGLYSNFFR